jgi:hypothetical protein
MSRVYGVSSSDNHERATFCIKTVKLELVLRVGDVLAEPCAPIPNLHQRLIELLRWQP